MNKMCVHVTEQDFLELMTLKGKYTHIFCEVSNLQSRPFALSSKENKTPVLCWHGVEKVAEQSRRNNLEIKLFLNTHSAMVLFLKDTIFTFIFRHVI